MKSVFSILLIFVSAFAFAKPYSMITKTHTHQGCTYYDVTIWDDNGTPADRSDDVMVASGVINDCIHHPESTPQNGTTGTSSNITTIEEFDDLEQVHYTVEILNNSNEQVAVTIITGDL